MAQIYRVQVVPGNAAPLSAPSINTATLNWVVPPAGVVADMFDRLTGSYNILELQALAAFYFDLKEAGVWGKFDSICVRLKNEADSLLNLAGTGSATNTNATFTVGEGFEFASGDSSIVDLDFDPVLHTITDASMFVNVTSENAVNPIGGSIDGSVTCRITPNQAASTEASFRMHSASDATASYTGDRDGLWIACREDGDVVGLRNGVELARSAIGATTIEGDGNLGVGRISTSTYATFTGSAFGYGAALNTAQASRLKQRLDELHAVI